MRIFVTGTGRCGTTTFAKACSHINNYTSAHETPIPPDLVYPDNHIEVSPHLTWVLPLVTARYPDALYVHLRRRRELVVRSWIRRGRHRGPGFWEPLVWAVRPREFRTGCELCHDAMIALIAQGLADRRHLDLNLESITSQWRDFWEAIGAEGNYANALAELRIHHNAS